jgi:hypothetical protein
MEGSQMKNHVTLVGVLHLGFGVMGIMVAALIYALFMGIGVVSGDEEAFAILTLVATPLAALLVVLSLPGVLGGIWLLKYRRWARVVILIVSVLDLVNIPFGTALGVYSLWVLLHSETEKLFSAAAGTPLPQGSSATDSLASPPSGYPG